MEEHLMPGFSLTKKQNLRKDNVSIVTVKKYLFLKTPLVTWWVHFFFYCVVSEDNFS